ncbi:sugar phosphate isomerase/epimerase family protein [Labrys okinawensis]|uniref:sugar phosphate isomerase/epimerase family protein n=1 Tax=Labrys okinawensis TaxID=346911 RepID=UPI0039BC9EF3
MKKEPIPHQSRGLGANRSCRVEGRSLEDLLPVFGSLGIDPIEINEDYSRLPQYGSAPGRRNLRSRILEAGLRVASTWFYIDMLGAVETSSLTDLMDQIDKCFEIASDLGAEVVVMTPADSLPKYMTERGVEKFRHIVEELVCLARSYKLTVGLESARSQGTVCTPQAVTRLVREIGQAELTVVPDFEAWRVATEDLPLSHVERQETIAPAPAELKLFKECLPLARLVHAKLLRLDQAGEEPHFPIAEMMSAIRSSHRPHVITIEYEGWVPDIDPYLDCVEETRRCVQLIKRNLAT